MEKVKKVNLKEIENKVALSLRKDESRKILFRLINTKKNNSKSFAIYEKAKHSTTLKEAFNNDYRYIDIQYDTTKNNRFKRVNLLLDKNSYLDVNKKDLYLDLINSNKSFIKENNIKDKNIIENISYFEKRINELK